MVRIMIFKNIKDLWGVKDIKQTGKAYVNTLEFKSCKTVILKN